MHNKFNLDLEYDTDFTSMEMEDQGVMELSDQEEEQPADSMEPLVCREGDLFSNSQVMELVNNPTQDPVVCPAWDAETEEALQPGNFSWADDVEKQDVALLEQNLEEHQGPGAQSLPHFPLETSEQEVSGDGVKLGSNQSEPDIIQDIVSEA